jgi:hypothetical protein
MNSLPNKFFFTAMAVDVLGFTGVLFLSLAPQLGLIGMSSKIIPMAEILFVIFAVLLVTSVSLQVNRFPAQIDF